MENYEPGESWIVPTLPIIRLVSDRHQFGFDYFFAIPMPQHPAKGDELRSAPGISQLKASGIKVFRNSSFRQKRFRRIVVRDELEMGECIGDKIPCCRMFRQGLRCRLRRKHGNRIVQYGGSTAELLVCRNELAFAGLNASHSRRDYLHHGAFRLCRGLERVEDIFINAVGD